MALLKTRDRNNFEEILEWSCQTDHSQGSDEADSGTPPPHRVDAATSSAWAWGRGRKGGSPSQVGQHRGRVGSQRGWGIQLEGGWSQTEASLPHTGCQKHRCLLKAEASLSEGEKEPSWVSLLLLRGWLCGKLWPCAVCAGGTAACGRGFCSARTPGALWGVRRLQYEPNEQSDRWWGCGFPTRAQSPQGPQSGAIEAG